MRFALYIAKRYFFSKKKHHAINWVSIISVCGVAVSTIALICILSVFNGFQSVIEGLFSNFDPPLEITAVRGKTFEPDSIKEVLQDAAIETFCEVIQDNALVCYGDKQQPVRVKGVPTNYNTINQLDSILLDGRFSLDDKYVNTAVLGVGLARTLGAGVHFVEPFWLYVPRRNTSVNMLQPEKSFYREFGYVSGIFMVQQEKYDQQLMLVSLDLARKLYDYPTCVTAIELKLKPGSDEKKVQARMQQLLGDDYRIKNRYEQQEDFFHMLQVEKWVTYLILSFILLIAVFNIIGSLSMLMIDKKKDVQVLQNLGATSSMIRTIFLLEGWMIAVVGALVGVVIGLFLCFLQMEFGLISLGGGDGFVIADYPVKIVLSDILLVLGTVILLGFLAAFYPAKHYNDKE